MNGRSCDVLLASELGDCGVSSRVAQDGGDVVGGGGCSSNGRVGLSGGEGLLSFTQGGIIVVVSDAFTRALRGGSLLLLLCNAYTCEYNCGCLLAGSNAFDVSIAGLVASGDDGESWCGAYVPDVLTRSQGCRLGSPFGDFPSVKPHPACLHSTWLS